MGRKVMSTVDARSADLARLLPGYLARHGMSGCTCEWTWDHTWRIVRWSYYCPVDGHRPGL
jgi:hypothetical protein